MKSILKLPSAWIPIVMSLAVLATFFTGIALYGVPVREADEGTAARLFQIWLLLEVLMVAFFAIKWLPRRPMHAPTVLAIQIIAVLAACAPVYFLNL